LKTQNKVLYLTKKLNCASQQQEKKGKVSWEKKHPTQSPQKINKNKKILLSETLPSNKGLQKDLFIRNRNTIVVFNVEDKCSSRMGEQRLCEGKEAMSRQIQSGR
jgi:hypothetical protein